MGTRKELIDELFTQTKALNELLARVSESAYDADITVTEHKVVGKKWVIPKLSMVVTDRLKESLIRAMDGVNRQVTEAGEAE